MDEYIFYEIKCNDPLVTETYIGSTKNFNNRKKTHKHRCNIDGRGHHAKVYCYIRANGGWDNFTMTEIDRGFYADVYDAEEYEFFLMKERQSYLNVRYKHWTEESNKIHCSSQYYANREERLKTAAEYREANRELLRQKQQAYRDANRDLYNEKYRERREKNKEKINARRRELNALKKQQQENV